MKQNTPLIQFFYIPQQKVLKKLHEGQSQETVKKLISAHEELHEVSEKVLYTFVYSTM